MTVHSHGDVGGWLPPAAGLGAGQRWLEAPGGHLGVGRHPPARHRQAAAGEYYLATLRITQHLE